MTRLHCSSAELASVVLAALLLLFHSPLPAIALTVEDLTGTTVAPADDPGWAAVTTGGLSAIYLGDSWVLTAVHNGVGTLIFEGGTFDPIRNQKWIVPNPTSWGGTTLSSQSDIRLYRINGDLDIPDLTITATSLVAGDDVVIIADGYDRADNPSTWYVNKSTNPWTWQETPDSGLVEYTGYKRATSSLKRWGTNQVSGPNADVMAAHGVNNWNGVIEVTNNIDIVAQMTIFDENGDPHETHALAGDSGGAVFYKRDDNWELAGILHTILPYPGQSPAYSVYGNATFFSDLAVYRDSILDIITTHSEYSILGDLDLDGDIDGDDLDDFVAGWGTDEAEHNIETWKRGDLDLDGDTDLADFALLRAAYPAAGQIAGLLAVPEPSSWLLFAIAGLGLAWRRSLTPARNRIG